MPISCRVGESSTLSRSAPKERVPQPRPRKVAFQHLYPITPRPGPDGGCWALFCLARGPWTPATLQALPPAPTTHIHTRVFPHLALESQSVRPQLCHKHWFLPRRIILVTTLLGHCPFKSSVWILIWSASTKRLVPQGRTISRWHQPTVACPFLGVALSPERKEMAPTLSEGRTGDK
jgi:hypothetical protein